jgi:iron(III) transport system permease protein
MPFKPLFRGITLMPLLAPSLLSAISLIYWFGNQGVLKGWMQGMGIDQIYGAPGIVLAECFAVFPHALMILVTALSLSDARLYEAADAMGTRAGASSSPSPAGRQVRPDLGGAGHLHAGDHRLRHPQGDRRQLQCAGHRRVQAGDRPAGFSKGAVVAMLLLAPAVLTFGSTATSAAPDGHAHARAVPYGQAVAGVRPADDTLLRRDCASGAGDAGHGGVRLTRQLLALQPAPSLRHYTMGLVDAEVGDGFVNSLKMAAGTALFRHALVFAAPTCWRRPRAWTTPARLVRLLAMLPMAVPGLVLGLGYIFFFNAPPTRSTGCTTRWRC